MKNKKNKLLQTPQYTTALGLRSLMDGGKIDGLIANRFDFLSGTLDWARENMPEQFQPSVTILNERVSHYRRYFKHQITRMIPQLQKDLEKAAPDAAFMKAFNSLNEEFHDDLETLTDFIMAIAQYRDGYQPDIETLAWVLSTTYDRFVGVDAVSDERKSVHLPVGNTFLFKLSNEGPHTDVAAVRGMKTHLMGVPYEHLNSMVFSFPAYLHELCHSIWAEIPSLWQETQKLAARAVDEKVENGRLALSKATLKIGDIEIPMARAIGGIYYDMAPEIVADVFGVLSGGPAYLYNLLMSLPALYSDSDIVAKTIPLLGSFSYYRKHSDDVLIMDPHPPDTLRVELIACVLDALGFARQAAECRKAAGQAASAGTLSWRDSEGKSEETIEIDISDMLAVADHVARTLLESPLVSLNGLSLNEMITWTCEDEKEVERLTEELLDTSITDQSVVENGNHLIAAATMALWRYVEAGCGDIDKKLEEINQKTLARLSHD